MGLGPELAQVALSVVCICSLMASAQQPGMTACCLTLPLPLSHQLPGKLYTVLMVTRGQMDST